MTNEYDFIVIGGGSAGYAGARTAAEMGKRVAIVDGADSLGGLCILAGCMPSKTLIYSAEVLHMAQRGGEFGLNIPSADADGAAIQKRKREIIAEFAEYRQKQLKDDRFDLYRTTARFTDANTLELANGIQLKSSRILIATGSRVNKPDVTGLDQQGIWTSDDVLNLTEIPESVIVLGGGSIACELAQYLCRVGSKVTLIQRSRHILTGFSDEAAEVVEEVMREEGIELYTDTNLTAIEAHNEGFAVRFQQDGEELKVEVKHVMNAMGRHPNTEGLSLESVGVNLQASGHVKTDSNQETSVSGIYAAGDVSGPDELVHLAVLQGENAAKAAFGHSVVAPVRETLLSVVFTDPQVAHVGLNQEQMDERGMSCVCADYPFDDHGKSILMGGTHGYVKTWVEKVSGKLIAAECVGKDASELIHSMSLAVYLEADARKLIKAPWYHPTLSEIWTYPLEECVENIN